MIHISLHQHIGVHLQQQFIDYPGIESRHFGLGYIDIIQDRGGKTANYAIKAPSAKRKLVYKKRSVIKKKKERKLSIMVHEAERQSLSRVSSRFIKYIGLNCPLHEGLSAYIDAGERCPGEASLRMFVLAERGWATLL